LGLNSVVKKKSKRREGAVIGSRERGGGTVKGGGRLGRLTTKNAWGAFMGAGGGEENFQREEGSLSSGEGERSLIKLLGTRRGLK